MHWTDVADAQNLKEKGSLVVKRGGRQIVLFAVEDQLFAMDNRCPHEGYPLKAGTVDGKSCVLTCQWHNWKFDMHTGKTLLGEDQVRTYPVREVAGRVQLDLTEPDPELQRDRIMGGLMEAVAKGQYGRIARELARLETLGLGGIEALVQVMQVAAPRMEYGMSHAWAATADWLVLYDAAGEDVEQWVITLTEAVHHLADDARGEPEYPYAAERVPFDGPGFLRAVEAQDEAVAVGMMRDALNRRLTWDALEPWLARAALDHYLAFGHVAIYVRKSGDLLARLGHRVGEAVLLPLVRLMVTARREDLIPDFRAYAAARADEPAAWGTGPLPAHLRDPFGLNIPDALAWVREALGAAAPNAVYQRLLGTLAGNLLYYDEGYQQATHRPVQHNVNFLDFTHGLTLANAVRVLCERHPELWYPALLQLACFVGRNTPYLDLAQDVSVYRVDDVEAFARDSLSLVTDHGLSEPVFSCHLLKTRQAVLEELAHLDAETGADVAAALNRFLHAPLKERHVRRTVRQALSLVGR